MTEFRILGIVADSRLVRAAELRLGSDHPAVNALLRALQHNGIRDRLAAAEAFNRLSSVDRQRIELLHRGLAP